MPKLRKIEAADPKNLTKCLSEMIHEWINTDKATWIDLHKALVKIGNQPDAVKLAKEHGINSPTAGASAKRTSSSMSTQLPIGLEQSPEQGNH